MSIVSVPPFTPLTSYIDTQRERYYIAPPHIDIHAPGISISSTIRETKAPLYIASPHIDILGCDPYPHPPTHTHYTIR